MEVRNLFFRKRIFTSTSFPLPIISIGNLAVGGTGKTPHIEFLIRLLKDEYKTAVLSRGYKRKTKGFVKADEYTTANEIGDEPFQIHSKFSEISVFVDEKRVHGVNKILQIKPDTEVILLDDAYQHQYIKPGLSILLTDFSKPFTQDFVLPYGSLRERRKNADRADIIMVTKCPLDTKSEDIQRITKEINPKSYQHIFFSGLEYGEIYPVFDGEKIDNKKLKNLDILLVSAIVNPFPMINYIEKLAKSIETITFADHHYFSEKELKEIEEKTGNKIILTTEKDAARLKSMNYMNEELKKKIYALPLHIKILNNQENIFNQKIYDYVGKNSRNR